MSGSEQMRLRAGGGLEDFGTIDARKVLNIIALVVSLGVVIYGSIKFDWDYAGDGSDVHLAGNRSGIISGLIRIPFARTS